MIYLARQARGRCDSGVYHIIMRGVNRQDIFLDNDDFQRFMGTVERVKSGSPFDLYGYCLMSNHIHLLLHENGEEIPQIMKRIGGSYAWWYNRKYERSGHVFQGRYRSECVENDSYLLTVIRYIHNNPVKAGMVSNPEEYRWSSMQAYWGKNQSPFPETNSSFILGLFTSDKAEAIKQFQEFMTLDNKDECLEDEIKHKITDSELKLAIEALLNGRPVTILQTIQKQKRNEILRQIKLINGATQRQIARVTGLNQSLVFKA